MTVALIIWSGCITMLNKSGDKVLLLPITLFCICIWNFRRLLHSVAWKSCANGPHNRLALYKMFISLTDDRIKKKTIKWTLVWIKKHVLFSGQLHPRVLKIKLFLLWCGITTHCSTCTLQVFICDYYSVNI